jgi:hypothetical protein
MKTTVEYSETSVRYFQIARRYIPQWTNFHTSQFEHRMNTCLAPSQFCYFITVLFRQNIFHLLQPYSPRGEYGELRIMLAKGRWSLTRRLKG